MAVQVSEKMQRFIELRRVAENTIGSQPLSGLRGSAPLRRWVDLTERIDNYIASCDMGKSIFYYALHALKWGLPTQSCPEELDELSSAITKEILENDQARKAWNREKVYQECCMEIYRQKRAETSDRENIRSSWFDLSISDHFRLLSQRDLRIDCYRRYAIYLLLELLPEENLDDFNNLSRLTDEVRLFQLINEKYQVDYNANPEEFDRLVEMYRLEIDKKDYPTILTQVPDKLCLIHKCSFEIMKAIWGENADEHLISLFYRGCKEHRLSADFQTSWFYSWLLDYADNNASSEKYPNLKRDVFDACLGIR